MEEIIQHYAGFWRRFAAYMIDQALIAWALNEFWGSFFNFARASFAEQRDFDIYRYWETIATVCMWALTIPLVTMYHAGMESSPLQATMGKFAVGIYVTDLQGQRISFKKAAGRIFGKFISGAILGIGYLMAGFTEKKQALHDSMSGCLVMRR